MREIPVVDTTLRDAHQCLWATRMTTAHMLPIAERMDKMGFQRIDLAGTIQFDVCVRYLKENPWERVRLMRERITRDAAELIHALKEPRQLRRGARRHRRAVGRAAGRQRLPRSRHLRRSQRRRQHAGNDRRRPLARRQNLRRAFLQPVAVHTDELYVRTAADLVKRGKVDAIWLKDAGGLLTVDRIRTLVPAIKKAIGEIPLELHSHCITGLAPLVYLEGVKAGADRIHTSIAPLANGSAQPSTQSMARNLRALSYRVDARRCADRRGRRRTSAASRSRRESPSARRRNTTRSTTSTRSPAA